MGSNIKNYDNFNNGYKVNSYSREELIKIIFDGGKLKDKTLQNRIRFFIVKNDFGWGTEILNFHFIVLYHFDKIIGISKIGNYKKDRPSHMEISYFSIDRDYRGKGLMKLMIIELMKLCQKNNYTLGSSSWTLPGNLKLRPSIKKYAKIYKIDFEDNDRTADAYRFYNKDLISRHEMIKDEENKFNNGDVYAKNPVIKSNFFKYNTGEYTIYSSFKKDKFKKINSHTKYEINKIFDDIIYRRFKYKKNRITIYRENNDIYIIDGDLIMYSFLKNWIYVGDYQYINKLIDNAIVIDKKPSKFYKFPLSQLFKLNESFSYNFIKNYENSLKKIEDDKVKIYDEYKPQFLEFITLYMNYYKKSVRDFKYNDTKYTGTINFIRNEYKENNTEVIIEFMPSSKLKEIADNHNLRRPFSLKRRIYIKYLPAQSLYEISKFLINKLSNSLDNKNLFKQLNESKKVYKDPKWFYLVLRDGCVNGGNNHEIMWESLSKMKFENLRGISDNSEISRSWFDIRQVMLIMPAKDVIQLNNPTKIEYYNPDQLVNNNFEILIRIFDNEKSTDQYSAIRLTLDKIFQNILHIEGSKIISINKLNNKTYIKNLISLLSDYGFYYNLIRHIIKRIKNGYIVNNIDDLSYLIGEYIENNKDIIINIDSFNLRYKDLIKHYERFDTTYISKIIKWSLTYIAKIYNKSEGEWILPKKHTFIVPDNSYLFFKKTPSVKNIEKYQEWLEDIYKINKIDYTNECGGIKEEILYKNIHNYNLLKNYNIEYVKHSFEMKKIIEKRFSNK